MDALIDDFSDARCAAGTGTGWRLVSDAVMGGISTGTMTFETRKARPALRLRGEVRTENDGGFLQAALDVSPDGGATDAGAFTGLAFMATGNDETYGVHLRTIDLDRPWQSFRATFAATPNWRRIDLAFADFRPHRTDRAFDPARLRRIGLAAIGRAFLADLAVSDLRLRT